MLYQIQKLLVLSFILQACHTGKLDLVAHLPSSLKEASAIEKVPNSDLLWTIEDNGNKNNVYGINTQGEIIKNINISNATNEDWEDLTSDAAGNLYIGDFGNNSKNRDIFTIYKISDLKKKNTTAERIDFVLPKEIKSKDFEAFFLYKNHFYVFSKEYKTSILVKIPNTIGKHTAELVTEFNLKGKHNRITSADISADSKTIVLLNHDKLWKITHFESDDVFQGDISEMPFKHDSQKEGITFKNQSTVYITDEKNKSNGGKLYTFKLD
ncbi:hypothetical protein KFZ70_07280 [Tamlana fucoidanivorans]|uniref:PE-PGRS family protein n=1 Tax=Allotamlana fucoidanivorans TaxID=2583814 RepID=A0A5C4SNG5_9FLAO|nr:hypothetical protein [Tamlana fucoidanivorans]TNJ45190.1 hypothetical protein FGF67_05635 [Tamlana fucoidanivorans]